MLIGLGGVGGFGKVNYYRPFLWRRVGSAPLTQGPFARVLGVGNNGDPRCADCCFPAIGESLARSPTW